MAATRGLRRLVEPVGHKRAVACELRVRRLESPARKDEAAEGEIDLVMAHHHEDFEPRPAAAQQ
jgi:hypothetical protein